MLTQHDGYRTLLSPEEIAREYARRDAEYSVARLVTKDRCDSLDIHLTCWQPGLETKHDGSLQVNRDEWHQMKTILLATNDPVLVSWSQLESEEGIITMPYDLLGRGISIRGDDIYAQAESVIAEREARWVANQILPPWTFVSYHASEAPRARAEEILDVSCFPAT